MNTKEENNIRKIIQEQLHKHYGEPLPLLLEYSRMNKMSDSVSMGNKVIYIYGEDRNTMTPHFHYFNEKDNSFHVEIELIGSNINPIILISDARVGVPENRLKSWDGLRNERKALLKWLSEKSKSIPLYTNYQHMVSFWNDVNQTNEIPEDVVFRILNPEV
jgi:hypothetical protein